MPNRMLRFTCDSRRVNALTETAEVVFYRLIQVADDFGSYIQDPELLLSAIYPRKTPGRMAMTEERLDEIIQELATKDLLLLYSADEKNYLRIKRFNQRLQNFRNAWPHPPESKSPGVTGSHRDSPPEREEEEEPEKEIEIEVERESGIRKLKTLSLSHMIKYLEKHKARLFPAELSKAQAELRKIRDRNGWSDEALMNDPELMKKYDVEDSRIYNKHLKSLMEKEADKCWNHYAKQNFKINGEKITAWAPVIAGWMTRRETFMQKK